MYRSYLLAVALIVGLAAAGQAQVVPNPTTITFTASADHDVVGLEGQPLVDHYEVLFALEATPNTISKTVPIGKPTPAVGGLITVTNPALLTMEIKNRRYLARVAAVGPTGQGTSDPSNPFGTTGPPGAGGAPTVTRQAGGGGSSSSWAPADLPARSLSEALRWPPDVGGPAGRPGS